MPELEDIILTAIREADPEFDLEDVVALAGREDIGQVSVN